MSYLVYFDNFHFVVNPWNFTVCFYLNYLKLTTSQIFFLKMNSYEDLFYLFHDVHCGSHELKILITRKINLRKLWNFFLQINYKSVYWKLYIISANFFSCEYNVHEQRVKPFFLKIFKILSWIIMYSTGIKKYRNI